MPIKAPFNN
jgi:hypothetical protein